MTKHGIRECRGHWHVTTADGEFDLAGYCKDEAAARALAAEYDEDDAAGSLTREERAEFNAINRSHATPIVQLTQEEYAALLAAEAALAACQAAADLNAPDVRAWHRAYSRIVTGAPVEELKAIARDYHAEVEAFAARAATARTP